jgi:hypothetical protein
VKTGGDLQAVCQIHEAIKTLPQPGVIAPGSVTAAKAFGQLFVGAGRLAESLPPPANSYGQFLKSAGDFFVNMQRKLDPELRPTSRQQLENFWREEREMYGPR